MAKRKIRIKAKEKKGIVKATIMAQHEMRSYSEAKKAKKEVNFITSMTATVNGNIVYEVSTSQFLSTNPVVKFKFKGNKGDKITFAWTDLKGNTKEASKKIK